jgi:hypothetical protein
MSNAGKGSKPRPLSVSDQEYANRWNAIFAKDEYYDILTTEDCLVDSETNKITRNNQETQEVQNFKVDSSGKSLL